jgi:hypothetical protein
VFKRSGGKDLTAAEVTREVGRVRSIASSNEMEVVV